MIGIVFLSQMVSDHAVAAREHPNLARELATRRGLIGDGTPPVPSVTKPIPIHSVSRLTMRLAIAPQLGSRKRKIFVDQPIVACGKFINEK